MTILVESIVPVLLRGGKLGISSFKVEELGLPPTCKAVQAFPVFLDNA